MKKLLTTLCLVLLVSCSNPSLVVSEEFVYVCSNENGFILNFQINTLSKTITHTSSSVESSENTSYVVGGGITPNLPFLPPEMRKMEILNWDYPKVLSLGLEERFNNYIIKTRYFNFRKGKMVQFDSEGDGSDSMSFDCERL